MGDVIDLLPKMKKTCCELECRREATQTIPTVDENGKFAGRKFFCDAHAATLKRLTDQEIEALRNG